MVKVIWQVPILLHYNRGMQLSIAYIIVQIRKAKPLSLVFLFKAMRVCSEIAVMVDFQSVFYAEIH
jgi:hypothetical protein